MMSGLAACWRLIRRQFSEACLTRSTCRISIGTSPPISAASTSPLATRLHSLREASTCTDTVTCIPDQVAVLSPGSCEHYAIMRCAPAAMGFSGQPFKLQHAQLDRSCCICIQSHLRALFNRHKAMQTSLQKLPLTNMLLELVSGKWALTRVLIACQEPRLSA